MLCSTSDHAFSQSLGTRIVELTPAGIIDRHMSFDEYMTDPKISAVGPVPGHQCGPGGRTGRSNMIIGQPDRLIGQTVQMWSLNNRIASTSEISISKR